MNPYRIPEIAKQYTDYDMIRQHTDLPDFPNFRAQLLYAFLSRDSRLNPSSELFALVTSLVQMGLDTHDEVTVSNEVKEKKAARSRQLKVLAGDYFSSRFYHLLSQAGQIDLIKRLSTAICELNRLKTNLYVTMKHLKVTTEDYVRQSVDIKSHLFKSFGGLMEEVNRRSWPEILEAFTRCEVIFKEIFRSESLQDFHGSWGYWHIIQNGSKEERKLLEAQEQDPAKLKALIHKYNVPSQLYNLLVTQLQQLEAKVKQLDSDKLASELFHIGEPFFRFISKTRLLEER
ncbi:heptaprenyl diphosphate synthase [Paenibacillus chitinolyticus]|uniref:Heptaprenyl diphosphate synthase n=1 Tax=Paenibacillus chitinolyticus TaxID=79263 RepID=A0A410WV16_9BACL|nr:heptaprenyl diphosphate synthase component 1 [Paenibacillus chitinolyticus]MCY9589374.1 heptaprenyl diphosphate synthase component 1 [Paenibacillus chitinolyticus]MCY9594447.1 heptaprenyl diphosphate synthase component 1 [Paenibacillus chitinolyticus]QAV18306.1 heptaprenyl diphosphate synthase [Paenibacillus chitinolyticus]